MCQSCDVWEALRRLDFVRRRALRPRLLALGLTLGEGQPRILNRLLRRGAPMTQRELADACWLDTATLSRTLDRMEAANLIYRDRGDKDRRKILIFLTEEAKGLEQEYNEVTEEISNIYYKGFSEEEIEQLESYLHRILKNVEEVL